MGINNTGDDNLSFLENHKIFAFIALGLAIIIYAFSKTGLEFEISSAGDMGAFGDFFGGVLNPTFTLLGLLALLSTIRIQSKALQVSSEELLNSRKELELTREELSRSTLAQQEQSESIKLQNFENTFFNMIDLHNSNISNLILTQYLQPSSRIQYYFINNKPVSLKDNKDYNSKKAIAQLVSIFKQYNKDYNENDIVLSYEYFYKEYEEILSHYFDTIYQILYFIKQNENSNKSQYSNLFRSQFSKSELKLLYYHGTSRFALKTLKPLLESFQFLEYIDLKNENEKDICRYKYNAYGNNEYAYLIFGDILLNEELNEIEIKEINKKISNQL